MTRRRTEPAEPAAATPDVASPPEPEHFVGYADDLPPERPRGGGSYVRQPDGTLKKKEA